MSHLLEAMNEKKHSRSSSPDERRSETKSYGSLGKRHVERGSDEAGEKKKATILTGFSRESTHLQTTKRRKNGSIQDRTGDLLCTNCETEIITTRPLNRCEVYKNIIAESQLILLGSGPLLPFPQPCSRQIKPGLNFYFFDS